MSKSAVDGGDYPDVEACFRWQANIIFEALSLVKRAVHEGKIRKSRGALFVAIVKRACAERGVVSKYALNGAR